MGNGSSAPAEPASSPTENPKIVLHYFDTKGRGEWIRLILEAKELEYEDHRVSGMEAWGKIKPEMPFNQLPVLDYGDLRLAHSTSITRFVAKKADLLGDSERVGALADMVFMRLMDFIDRDIFPAAAAKDEVDKLAAATACAEEKLPLLMQHLEDCIDRYGGAYVAGEQVLSNLDVVQNNRLELLKDYPKLNALVTEVGGLERIRAYEERMQRKNEDTS